MRIATKLFTVILVTAVILLTGCKLSAVNTDEVVNNTIYKTEENEDGGPSEVTLASDGLAHEPYGWDNLYGSKEVPTIWWERLPRDPQSGDIIEVSIAVWEDAQDMDVWLEWRLNGDMMPTVDCSHRSNLKDGGIYKKKYIGMLGPFSQGDRIEYSIYAGLDREAKRKLGPFSFTILDWEPLQMVTKAFVRGNTVVAEGVTASLKPKLILSFPQKGMLKLAVSPVDQKDSSEQAESSAEAELSEPSLPVVLYEVKNGYVLSNGGLNLEIGQEPFKLSLCDASGNVLLMDTAGDGIEILTDGNLVRGIRLNIASPQSEEFYGFGMKYDSLNQRNKIVHTYCVNWYTDQSGETYTPVPYYFVPDKYGIFVDSTYYSKFDISSSRENVCSIDVLVGQDVDPGTELYILTGSNQEIADGYTDIAGKPVLPPVWAFGPWISANEWNRQAEVTEQLEMTKVYDIPTSVIVLEAWSDEETFYTFNDSEFQPMQSNEIPKLSDFRFGGRWPDPKGMVDMLHDNNIKLLLWQIPVLKHSGSATIQSIRDQSYAITKDYILKNEDGTDYRIPSNTWFGDSMLIDFTNPSAVDWFLSKRQYLLEELGIDGFKTDGGEFVWGRQVTAYDGTKGDELRNAYSDLYAQAYFDYARIRKTDAITFSRSGGANMQNHPICWIGDQKSTPKAFKNAVIATLSASMSGIPFVAWDIAGFSGDVPSTELYQRAVAQAAFSPIMQVHSETGGDPIPSQARTPWNMAERKGSSDCLDTYRYFANVRMSLLPYIYTEAKHSSMTGEPLMRSMAYAYPYSVDIAKYGYQYMFGSRLLVAPVLDITKKSVEVCLPEGVWYNLFDGKEYESGIHNIECPLGELPVFVREGTILPMNLNDNYELGGRIGNRTDNYQNLTFRIYPGEGSYQWYDYVRDAEVSIEASLQRGMLKIRDIMIPVVIEVYGKFDKLCVNDKELAGTYDTVSSITRYYWDPNTDKGDSE